MMPLSVEKVEDKDLSTISEILFAAFYPSNPVDCLIYPFGLTASVSNCSLALQKSAFLERDTYHLKIIDSNIANQGGQPLPAEYGPSENEDSITKPTTLDNSILAYARFKLWRKDREATDWDKPYSIKEGELGSPGDVNLETARSFRGQQREMSRKFIKGRKCVCMSEHSILPRGLTNHFPRPVLQWLATHPSHQHRGAGTLLMEHVCELANYEGLDVFLQATPSGYPLYHKLGFEDIAAFDVDLGILAGEVANGRNYRTVLMKMRFTAPDPIPWRKGVVVWSDELFLDRLVSL